MVPTKKVVEFAESAVRDLEEIRDWYAEQQAEDVGMRFLREIFAKVEQLAEYPESGRIVTEFGLNVVRELIHPPFRVIYRIGEGKIWVVRIWRSERMLKMPE